MELAPADVPLSFEVTFDQDDLDVGMSVYDNTGSSPVLVEGPSAMGHVVANTYQGKFTATTGKSYIIVKAVYTDNTFSTLDTDYAQGSESIVAQSIAGGSGGCGSIIGYITNNNSVVGLVTC